MLAHFLEDVIARLKAKAVGQPELNVVNRISVLVVICCEEHILYRLRNIDNRLQIIILMKREMIGSDQRNADARRFAVPIGSKFTHFPLLQIANHPSELLSLFALLNCVIDIVDEFNGVGRFPIGIFVVSVGNQVHVIGGLAVLLVGNSDAGVLDRRPIFSVVLEDIVDGLLVLERISFLLVNLEA